MHAVLQKNLKKTFKMKFSRILHLISFAVIATFTMTSCFRHNNRENILKVYNWADYIDNEVVEEFETWYKEQTGEEVEVVCQYFDINEIMLAKIERGREDFDVTCPSDYMIERMLRKDLLLPIDRDFGTTPNYIDDNLSPFIIECINRLDAHGKNPIDYTAGYMWGTTGFLYNTKYVTEEEVSTWNVLHNNKFRNKILVKDAYRDVYSSVLIYLKQDNLVSGEITLDSLMHDDSDESIALVEEYIKKAKGNIAGWEADFGADIMTKENAYINLTWSGDAAWAIKEANAVGVSLDYRIPDEGSSVWFDGWVIPKYAKNVKAARYFINYMCRPDNAIRNMDLIGYVSTIGAPEVLKTRIDETIETPTDVSYFFGEEAKNVHINKIQYPDISVIKRCTMLHDTGDRTEQMIEMWARVKGDDVNTLMLTIILVSFSGLFVIAIIKRMKRFRRKPRHKRR